MSGGFMSASELEALGLARLGSNVLISRRASLYGAERISIGSNVRIDDFCVLSAGEGGIEIGSYIHVAVFGLLIGAGRILLEDFCNLSSRVAVYSSSDDYSGGSMTNPMIPDMYKEVERSPVRVGRHVIIGSGSVILPGTDLGDGCAVGALSLVRGKHAPFSILAGTPATVRGERARDLLELERKFLSDR